MWTALRRLMQRFERPSGDRAISRDDIAKASYAAIVRFYENAALQRRLDAATQQIWSARRAESKNPLTRHGAKYFSQNDEDGITLEILRRLKLQDCVFAEFGVGDGLENNTLILLANGWRGLWIGGEPLKLQVNAPGSRLRFVQSWVTPDNCVALLKQGLAGELSTFDLLSVDLDGNDIHIVDRILVAGGRPRVVIVEYNSKFPPPIRFQIKYDPEHKWDGTDYFGASLQSFIDLFARYEYFSPRATCRASTRSSCAGTSGTSFATCPRIPWTATTRPITSSCGPAISLRRERSKDFWAMRPKGANPPLPGTGGRVRPSMAWPQ